MYLIRFIYKLFNQYYASHIAENEEGKVDILVGAFMLMEKELYLDLNGFDENCFMYADDIDLSYRAILNGKKNLINVPLTKNDSVPHVIQSTYGACHIMLRPASLGTGVIAGGSVSRR